MIGRFAARLGHRLPGHVVAGMILTLVGAWFFYEPLRHDYPMAEAIEIRKRRGAFIRFLGPDPFELQVVLQDDRRIVRYRNDLPHYRELKETLKSGTHVFHLWVDASDPDDATLVWQFDSGGRTLVSFDDTIQTLIEIRARQMWLPGAIAIFGLAIIALSCGAACQRVAPRSDLGRIPPQHERRSRLRMIGGSSSSV